GVRRPARLRRRDDEPRGCRARHAGLVGLRGAAGRRRRAARARGTPAPAHRSGRDRNREETGGRLAAPGAPGPGRSPGSGHAARRVVGWRVMVRVEHQVTINRPPSEVFAYITDMERIPEWQATALSGRLESE